MDTNGEPSESLTDEEYRKSLERELLPALRIKLATAGMSPKDAAYVCSVLWTAAHVPTITTLDEYRAARASHETLSKELPHNDLRSPAAIRLDALGGELFLFEEEYESEHGRPPPLGSA